MPSTRITKINIDRDQKRLIENMAAAQGISATKMLEIIILKYIAI